MTVARAAPAIPRAGKPSLPKMSTQLRPVFTKKEVIYTSTEMPTVPTERRDMSITLVMPFRV